MIQISTAFTLFLSLWLGNPAVPSGEALKLRTLCQSGDCFKNGWQTVGQNYKFTLNSECKEQDCAIKGWKAKDTLGNTYDVTCKKGGCFEEGWHAFQWSSAGLLQDEVFCSKEGCLKNGWDVKSSAQFSGVVSCKGFDCSKNGGKAFWRGHTSETFCLKGDCYHLGWDLEIK